MNRDTRRWLRLTMEQQSAIIRASIPPVQCPPTRRSMQLPSLDITLESAKAQAEWKMAIIDALSPLHRELVLMHGYVQFSEEHPQAWRSAARRAGRNPYRAPTPVYVNRQEAA